MLVHLLLIDPVSLENWGIHFKGLKHWGVLLKDLEQMGVSI